MSAERASPEPQRDRSRKHPVLERPPIIEVVCGFIFDSVPDLDIAELGVFWDSRRDAFPKKTIQPGIFEGGVINFGASALPARLVLTSADESRRLQLQHDRFLMNWRATGNNYPSFSGRDGNDGLGTEALHEFAKFSTFVRGRLDRSIADTVRRLDLTKIDLLARGSHWSDWDDLAKLLPITGTFQSVHRSDARDINLRFTEHAEGDVLVISLSTGKLGEEPAVRLDSRTGAAVSAEKDFRATLTRANELLNDVFFKLIPDPELSRFGAKGA